MRHAQATISSRSSRRPAPDYGIPASSRPANDAKLRPVMGELWALAPARRPSFVDNGGGGPYLKTGPGGTGQSQGASSRGFAISCTEIEACEHRPGPAFGTPAGPPDGGADASVVELLVRSGSQCMAPGCEEPFACCLSARLRPRSLEPRTIASSSPTGPTVEAINALGAGAGAPLGRRAEGAHRGVPQAAGRRGTRSTTCWCRPSPPCARRPSARSASAISTCS